MKKLALCVVLASGCAKTDSSDLLTTGIYAAIGAQATGDGTTRVYTTLYVGNPLNLNYVDLTGDDQLIATHNNDNKVMTETTLLNIVSHYASWTTDNEGDVFAVAFERTVDDGAPRSVATLPAKFAINAAPTTASRAQALTLTWGPLDAPNTMRWEAKGDCIELETQSLGVDTGTLTIEPDRLKKRMGDMVPDSCAITITVSRIRAGMLDPGYGKGGIVEGAQIRTVTLTSTL